MNSDNCAYDKDYLDHRTQLDYIYCESYFTDSNLYQYSEGRYEVVVNEYYDDSKRHIEYNANCSTISIRDTIKGTSISFNNIDIGGNLIEYINLYNDTEYLLFSIDLYGYSILKLDDFEVKHYVPSSSFREKEERFIWVEIHSSDNAGLIAVEGCYWACPYGVQVYDFSNPMSIPYRLVFDSYRDLKCDEDVDFIEWNDSVLKAKMNTTENINVTVDLKDK